MSVVARRGASRPGPAWSGVVAAGQTLRIVDLGGNQAVDCLLYDAARHGRALLGRRHRSPPRATSSSSPARVLRSNEGSPMMTITDTTCAYHDTIGGACSRESNTLRYGHHTAPPARLRRQLPRRGRAARARQAGPRLEHQLVHERAGRRRRHARHRRRHLRARACRVDLRAEMDVLVLISNCPQINNPCNGFDPTPVRVVVEAGDRADGDAGVDAERRRRAGVGRARVEVLDGGPFTTVQDLPGRVGYWHVGVPPNGPMDDLVHRLVNRVRRQRRGRRRARADRRGPDAALRRAGGRRARRRGDGDRRSTARPCRRVDAGRRSPPVRRRDDRRRRRARACGPRSPCGAGSTCRAVPRQPLDVHARRLRRPRRAARCSAGDVLAGRRRRRRAARRGRWPPGLAPVLGHDVGARRARRAARRARLPHRRRARRRCCAPSGGALQLGPHRRPPRRSRARGWARADGGEAGLHPSNIHDTGYAIGAVDLTGDMPIILGPDGPSLGGFVCPAVVAAAERWKLGQLAPGDRVRLVPWTAAEAAAADDRRAALAGPGDGADRAGGPPVVERPRRRPAPATDDAVLGPPRTPDGDHPGVTYRRAGDRFLLVEYGDDGARPRRCACASTLLDRWVAEHLGPASSTSPPASARCSCRSTATG